MSSDVVSWREGLDNTRRHSTESSAEVSSPVVSSVNNTTVFGYQNSYSNGIN